jgi:hypothetical protein
VEFDKSSIKTAIATFSMAALPGQRGITSASGTDNHCFESRQGVRFYVGFQNATIKMSLSRLMYVVQ